MRWWDFSDINFLTLFIIIVSIIFIIGIFVVSFLLFEKKISNHRSKIDNQSNSIYIFTINIKNSTVTYFSRSNLRKKITVEIAQFYNLINPNDVDRFKEWIYQICTSFNESNQYIDVDTIFEHNKNYFTVFKLNKYDALNRIILLESYTLKYIHSSNTQVKKHKGMISGVVKRSVMEKIINNSTSVEGYTFAIRFFYIHQAALKSENIERFTLMTLKNEIYPYLHNGKYPRQIVETSSNEIFLFDLKISERASAMSLAQSIALTLKKALSVRSFYDIVNFSIGVVENRIFYQNFNTIINQAQNACINAQQSGEQIIFAKYSRDGKIDVSKFSKDIDHLLTPGNVRYLFRPILDVRRNKIVGYVNSIRAYNSPFSSILEMSKYAARVNKGKELFAMFARNVIPKFASEAHDTTTKLFYYVSMYDIEYILSILPQINKIDKVNLVLVFDEQEIKDNSVTGRVMETFDILSKQKMPIALQLVDKDLILDPQLYNNFDYFIAGTSMLGEIRKNNVSRLSIHTLIERLLKYNKPIIATELEGWQSIELIIKAGISYISSEAISSSNDMIVPIDKKKLERIENMANKYLK